VTKVQKLENELNSISQSKKDSEEALTSQTKTAQALARELKQKKTVIA
jgi:DNA gyrase/topoisomerase IV subunit A